MSHCLGVVGARALLRVGLSGCGPGRRLCCRRRTSAVPAPGRRGLGDDAGLRGDWGHRRGIASVSFAPIKAGCITRGWAFERGRAPATRTRHRSQALPVRPASPWANLARHPASAGKRPAQAHPGLQTAGGSPAVQQRDPPRTPAPEPPLAITQPMPGKKRSPDPAHDLCSGACHRWPTVAAPFRPPVPGGVAGRA